MLVLQKLPASNEILCWQAIALFFLSAVSVYNLSKVEVKINEESILYKTTNATFIGIDWHGSASRENS